MKKYEYKIIKVKKPTEIEFNKLGQEGWKLVSSGTQGKTLGGSSFKNKIEWVFIREII